MSIVLCNSTSILLTYAAATSATYVAQTSTWASPYSFIFSFKAYVGSPIILVSTSLEAW
jgi:hypothetical protein